MRTLHPTNPPQHGEDVEHLQRLLGIPADGIYGQQTAMAVYRAKAFRYGYRTPDHSAGAKLIAYLEGKAKPTAAMLARAKQRRKTASHGGGTSVTPSGKTASRESLVRANAVSLMHYLMNHNGPIHYPPGDIRRQSISAITTRAEIDTLLNSNTGLIIDCSQYAELVAHVAGAKCPNGSYASNWRVDGFTGTLLLGCQHITKAQARPGDFHVYGPGTGHHVAVVFEPGSDPLMSSQGKESPDPHLIRDSVESRYQPAGGAWLRLPT